MKKLNSFFLKENAEALEKDEMKLILGGYDSLYVCCNGHCNTFFGHYVDGVFVPLEGIQTIDNWCSAYGGYTDRWR